MVGLYRQEIERASARSFDPATGEPLPPTIPKSAVMTWLERALARMEMKRPGRAPHSRAKLADALAAVTRTH